VRWSREVGVGSRAMIWSRQLDMDSFKGFVPHFDGMICRGEGGEYTPPPSLFTPAQTPSTACEFA